MDKFFLRVLLAGLIAVLSACGEESFTSEGIVGANGTTGTGTGSTGSTTVGVLPPTATATLTDIAGAAITTISPNNPGVLTVTVIDGDTGSFALGALVTATTSSLATLSPAGTAITDVNGVATLGLIAGSSAGAGLVTITVNYNGLSASLTPVGYSVFAATPPVVSTTLTDISGTAFNLITASNPGVITITVTDADTGGPAINAIITGTTSLGTLNPVTGTALTNSVGVATLGLIAGDVTGADSVNLSVNYNSQTTNATVGYSVAANPPSVTSTLTDAGGATIPTISALVPGTVTVTVIDGNTNLPAVGATVTASTGLATFIPSSGSVTTDAAGVATLGLIAGTTAGPDAVTITVDYDLRRSTITQNYSVSAFPPSVTVTLTDAGGTPISLISSSIPGTINIAVVDGDTGLAASGAVISASTTLATFNPLAGTALTDASGNATLGLIAGDVTGADSVTINVDFNSKSTTYNLFYSQTATVPGIATTLTDSGGTPITLITPNTPGTLTFTVTDGDTGLPANGALVTVATVLASTNPVGGSVLTNASGVATMQLIAGNTTGADLANITVNYNAKQSTDTVGYSVVAAPPTVTSTLTDAGGTPISLISATIPGTLTFTILDGETGLPAAGALVTATTSLATFSPAGTAIADGSGVASMGLIAGGVTGADTVNVTVEHNSITTAVTIAYSVAANPPAVSTTLTNAGGATITSIASDIPGTLTFTVTDGDTGLPAVSALVTATAGLSTFNPTAGTALTDGTGVATLEMLAGNVTGADVVNISVNYNSKTTTTTQNYTVVPPTIQIGSGTPFVANVLELGVATLSAGGTTSVTANLIDGTGALYTDPVDITFSSPCVAASAATIDTPVTTINGTVTATYLATGCATADLITATAVVGGATFTATATLTVLPASAGSIVFISSTPESITLQGTGGAGRSETSTVLFQVVDTNGMAVPNQLVDFALSTTVGGLTMSPLSALTDSAGNAQTIVQSGSVSTSVRVTASVNGSVPLLTSQSDQLVVTTGIPDQNSFSISVSAFNPNAWNYDGVQETVTVYLADHFNNPVPDGTAIAFQTEGGQIESACTTTAGTCSVKWTSADPRPMDRPVGDHRGRVTILATAIGEEGFADTAPSDGRYQTGELFTNLPEAFRDDNEDGLRDDGAGLDVAEEYLDFNTDFNYNPADAVYNGSLCDTGCTSSLLHVRAELQIIMSSNVVSITAYKDCNTATPINAGNPLILSDDGTLTSVCIKVLDSNLQPPPTDTSISAAVDVAEISGVATATPLDFTGDAYALDPLDRSKDLGISLKAAPCEPPDCSGSLTATVSIGGSSEVSASFPVSINDVTVPEVSSTVPVAGDITAVPNDPITVIFSEDMDPATITSSSFIVIEDPDNLDATDAAPVTITPVFVTYDSATKTATFLPGNMLVAPPGGAIVYEVTIQGGAARTQVGADLAATDSNGNHLDADYTWRFRSLIP